MLKPVAVVRSLCVLILVLAASVVVPARAVPRGSFIAQDDDVMIHRFEEPELWTMIGQFRGDRLISNDTCDGVLCGDARVRIVSFTQPANGLVRPVFAIDGDGNPTSEISNLEYIGRGGYLGDDTFTYTANDTWTGESSTATVRVHVQWDGTDSAIPAPADDTIILTPCLAAPCQPVDIRPLENDFLLESCTGPSDICPEPAQDGGYRFSIIDAVDTTSTVGTVVQIPGQPALIRYTPAPGFVGDDEFTYSILQNCGDVGEQQYSCSDTGIDVPGRGAIVRVRVRPPNQAPTAQSASYAVSANTSFAGSLVYSDPDGDALTVTLTQPPTAGVLTLTAPAFTYTPNGSSSTDAFIVSVSDGRGGSATATISFTVAIPVAPPVISGTPADMVVSATGPAGAVVNYSLPTAADAGGASVAVACLPESGVAFAIGTTTVTCTASDAHGNAATPTSFTVTVSDTTAPTIEAHAAVTAQATSAAGATVTYTAPATHDVVDGAGVATCAPASGSTFAIGDTTVTCTATDSHGNAATPTSFTVTVSDTTAPTIDAHAAVTAQATSAAGATVTYTAPATHDAVDGAGVATCAPASGSTFAIGDTTVTCTATDSHGNAATPTSFTVTVSDTTAPTIDAHTAVPVQATSAAGAAVTYTAPATHDAVDGTGAATCAPASGSTFAIGATTVICSATDSHGNAATPTSFTVTVSDTTAPTIDVHAAVTAQAASAAGAAVTYTAPATHDAVDGTGTATCAPASGSTFAIGATTVTCTAADSNGNAATPTLFTVTVSDTTAPTIDAHAAVTAQATSAAGAAVTYTAPATRDAVDGNGLATCAPASGSTFAIGTTTVSCTATDSHGNLATPTSFTVTVTAPTTTGTTPGSMSGEGSVLAGGDRYRFEFQVRENASGERGQFQLEVHYAKRTVLDRNGKPRQVEAEDGKFRSTGVTSVAFSDDPTIRPGRSPRPQVDTVLFTGVGRWNGQAGYTFEVRAADQGEPGRHRESISIVIRNAAGQVVAQAAGDLASGNVQSGRIKH